MEDVQIVIEKLKEYGNKGEKMIRVAKNRGTFYPYSCNEVEGFIKRFNELLDSALKDKRVLSIKPRAIISPHAGYIYSGFTANIAHRIAANSHPKRVIVIGPSHHVYFKGISVALFEKYETPCRELLIDLEFSKELAQKFKLSFVKDAHYLEHSTETQMPFISHYLPDTKVVELIYGDVSYIEVAKVIEYLLEDKDNLIVISTDLSHFHSLTKAQKLDSICIEGVAKEDISILERGCEACGIIGIKAIIMAAKRYNLKSLVLDYRTSADASGDITRVVGYMSALFY